MIKVTAQRIVTQPRYELFSKEVRLSGFDRLTPRAARAALEIAFGNSSYGVVWANGFDSTEGEYGERYGYRVYPNSARKISSEI